MTTTVCQWVLQEHGTGIFIKSQFLPDNNMQHYAYYHAIFKGLNAKAVTALIVQITCNFTLTC